MAKQPRKKMRATDFHVIKVIGRGSFGEVRVCYHKEGPDKKKLMAMKVLNLLLLLISGPIVPFCFLKQRVFVHTSAE